MQWTKHTLKQKTCLSCMALDKVFYFFKDFIYLFFRERRRKGEREGEKHQCVVAPHVSHLGIWPATQACALTRN